MHHIAVHARDSRPGPAAIVAGLRTLGCDYSIRVPMLRDVSLVKDATLAIVENLRGACAVLYEQYRARGVDVWILELPRLRMASGKDANLETLSYGLYKNSLHWLPLATGNRVPVFGPIPRRKKEYVLVCGQKQGDTSHGMDAAAMARWAEGAIAVARQYGLPVVYRPHPRSVGAIRQAYGADSYSDPTAQTMRQALVSAAAVVVHNSTSGVDAIDAGVPVLYTAPPEQCAYWQYAQPLGSPIVSLTAAERRVCLQRFAATQWTREQIADGTALACSFFGAAYPPAELVEMSKADIAAAQAEALGYSQQYAALDAAGVTL